MSRSVQPVFNDEIHAPMRLRTCALLSATMQMDFATLCAQLDVSDSVLSKHLARLENAGYVAVEKKSEKGHVRTWVRLTPEGRTVFEGHVAALQQLAAGVLPESGETA